MGKSKEKILFLETQLDSQLSSQRTQIGFMKSFLENYDLIEFIPKEVHSKSDLIKFLDYARKDKNIIAIHFSGHGEISKNKCSLVLTMDEKIDLTKSENQKIFRNLNNRVLFFSCCQIGNDIDVMNKILEISKAEAIFSYSDNIFDDQAFLIESLFYHLLIGYNGYKDGELSAITIYEKLKFALDYLLIDSREDNEPLRNPLLVADFYEDLYDS